MSEKECASKSTCSRESCEGCPSKNNPQSFLVEQNIYSNVKHVIGVVSGKGGVGKSLVTASLANLLAKEGYTVGILDADITGPSIPKMFGVHGPAEASDDGIEPLLTDNGIRLMSINLLLPDEESPVVWRGPVLANMVKQFWSEVMWGEVDYLLVDMPPGTGDVPLTVFQSLPVDGIIIVASPQELVGMIVEKAVKMANMMNIPVLGLVENMSYVSCPDCGKKIYIFGEGKVEETAAKYGLPVLVKLPIDPQLAKNCDQGVIELYEGDYMDKAMAAVEELLK